MLGGAATKMTESTESASSDSIVCDTVMLAFTNLINISLKWEILASPTIASQI